VEGPWSSYQRTTLYGMLSLSFLPRRSLLQMRRSTDSKGYDQTLLAGVQAIPAWNSYVPLSSKADVRYFGTPTGNLLGIITASLFLPAIFCSFIGDWLCTRFGRRITVMIGSVFIIAGGAWNGMSQNLAHFIACKFSVVCSEGY
jgi:MFS family permease